MPALAVDVRWFVDVDPRRFDRVLDTEPVLDDVDHDLHDRPAQARRAGAADDEAWAAVAGPTTIVGAIPCS